MLKCNDRNHKCQNCHLGHTLFGIHRLNCDLLRLGVVFVISVPS